MLRIISDKLEKQKCRKVLEQHFTQIKGFSKKYLNNKIVLANDDLSYITVLYYNKLSINTCFTLLRQDLRSQGLGSKYLKEQLEFCKLNFPNVPITRLVNKSNYVNLGLLIRNNFYIIGETKSKKSYKLLYKNK